jgi:hypothetical protein
MEWCRIEDSGRSELHLATFKLSGISSRGTRGDGLKDMRIAAATSYGSDS